MATVAENLQAIIDIKDDIKTAIENKGVDMNNTTFGDYANKIGEISGGVGKIDVGAMGLKFGNSTFTTIPDVFDFSNVIDISSMFENCVDLTTITELNTFNCITYKYMFYNCFNLITIPLIDCTNAAKDDIQGFSMFSIFTDCSELVNVGGLKNLGQSFVRHHSIEFKDSPNLSRQSCLNIFNNLYDISSKSFSSYCIIELHATAYNRLSTSDIAIATSKGWTVESA